MSQAGPVVVAAAPWVAGGVAAIRSFLIGYSAGKGVDELLGAGTSVRDSMEAMRDRLQLQASKNGANREILMRQTAILDNLRRDLDLLIKRRPSTSEASAINLRTVSAIATLESVQADHDRRLGLLETGQDSLRRLIASLLESGPDRQADRRIAATHNEVRPPTEPVAASFRAGPLVLSAKVVGFGDASSTASLVLSVEAEGANSREESVLCTDATLMDDRAGEWRLARSSGFTRRGPFNIVASSSGAIAYPLEQHTTFARGARQTAVLRFELVGRSSATASQVHLTMECYRRRGEWDERFALTSPELTVARP